jgi:uncharacterized protein (TIGR02996 family)
MSPEDGFLQDIIDHPDDDTPRLIYADWLEERGDPRGDFIRLQCELARMAADDPRQPTWQQRERWLQAEHPEFVGRELRELAKGWTFRRGFVEAVTVSAPVYLERIEELLRLAPIKEVLLDLSGVVLPQPILEYVPESVAREYVLLPLAHECRKLTLAGPDPDDPVLIEKLEFIFNQEVEILPAPADQLIEAINRHYGSTETEAVECVLYTGEAFADQGPPPR